MQVGSAVMSTLTGEPLDVVDLRHRRVRAVRYDLSRRVRVPASTSSASHRSIQKHAQVERKKKRKKRQPFVKLGPSRVHTWLSGKQCRYVRNMLVQLHATPLDFALSWLKLLPARRSAHEKCTTSPRPCAQTLVVAGRKNTICPVHTTTPGRVHTYCCKHMLAPAATSSSGSYRKKNTAKPLIAL